MCCVKLLSVWKDMLSVYSEQQLASGECVCVCVCMYMDVDMFCTKPQTKQKLVLREAHRMGKGMSTTTKKE